MKVFGRFEGFHVLFLELLCIRPKWRMTVGACNARPRYIGKYILLLYEIFSKFGNNGCKFSANRL